MGEHFYSQVELSMKYYKAGSIFEFNSSVRLILEWYPLNPCADIIFEKDLLVIVLDILLLVSLELLAYNLLEGPEVPPGSREKADICNELLWLGYSYVWAYLWRV